MICYDCIHYDVCPLGQVIIGTSDTCLKFKDKSDYVEVIRCRDCKYWIEDKDFGMFCTHWGSTLSESRENDFCSYGERKISND